MEFKDLKKDDIKSIRLTNIKLNEIKFEEQFSKVEEEIEEFEETLEGQDKERIMEEFFDVVQATMGLLTFYGISAKRLMNYYPTHLKKLKNRPRKNE